MLSTESAQQTRSKAAARSIDKILKVLHKEVAAIEKSIARLIDSNDDWSRKAEIV